jgi:hypothetical protein
MRLASSLVVPVAVFVISGCGSASSTAIGPSPSTGTLTMALKDSPFSDAKSLLVTFSEVDAHIATAPDGTWTKLPFADGGASRTCDLKKQQSAQDVLGSSAIPTGHYTQVRLVVSSATIYFDNAAIGAACGAAIAAPAGQSAPVTIPSGEVKINREFDVASTGATTVLLDFDGDQSVRQTGNGAYMMSPVIAVASVQQPPFVSGP